MNYESKFPTNDLIYLTLAYIENQIVWHQNKILGFSNIYWWSNLFMFIEKNHRMRAMKGTIYKASENSKEKAQN